MSPAGIELHIEDERSGLARVLRFEPDTGPIVIGRDEESHVHLQAQSISRRHAVIEKAPDGFVVTDESSLGTQHNGERLAKATATLLADRDELALPGFKITVRIHGSEAEASDDTARFDDLLAMAKGLGDEDEGADDETVTGTVHVIIDDAETQQQTIGGEGSVVLIGRSAECRIRLEDPYRIISGLHAKIERSWAGTFLYDLSRNGVFVNGEPIEDVRDLKDGDRITLAIAEAKAAAPTLVYREAATAGAGAGRGDATDDSRGPIGEFGSGDFDPGDRGDEPHPWDDGAAANDSTAPRPETPARHDKAAGGASASAAGDPAGGADARSTGAPADPGESAAPPAHESADPRDAGADAGDAGGHAGAGDAGAPLAGDAGSDADDDDEAPPKERDLFTLIVIAVAAIVIVLFAVIGFLMFRG